jgi:uncharacterized tellurite resistance protein B-like protein
VRKDAALPEHTFAEATRWVVVAMIVADGEIVRSEIERALTIVKRATGEAMTEEEIFLEAGAALSGRVPLDDELRRAGSLLNNHDKELLVRIAVDIAATDGRLAEGEIALVRRIAEDLGITSDGLRGIIAPGG